jgi:hypothetical protein
MKTATSSCSDRSFLCVVAEQHHEYCDKSFSTIERHKLVNSIGHCIAGSTNNSISEHIKRCHSLDYWCEKCLQKFNTSLPKKNLGHAKKEHKKECKRKPSPENVDIWNGHYILDQEQYHRFKVVGWRNTPVPNPIFINGKKETVPRRSWRKIRETIFPGSEIELNIEPVAPYRSAEDVVAIVGSRRSAIMPQYTDVPAPSTDLSQMSRLMPISPSMTTYMSYPSTQLSWETDSQTLPSSHVLSYSGTDGQQETHGIEFGNLAGPEYSFPQLRALEEYQGPQSSESLSGAGGWLPPLPHEVLMDGDYSDLQQAANQE